MFKSLRKMFIFIPCMILGLFFVSSLKVDAYNTELVGGKAITFGETKTNENTYFFTNSSSWEFKTDYKLMAMDTYLTYRVIKPNGEATKESEKINYVNADGSFNIGDYKELEFNETVDDMAERVSIAPASTYYIDIKYYGGFLGIFKWHQDKDETIKLVVCEDVSLSFPTVGIKYDAQSNKFSVSASVLKDGKGYSVIDTIEYYYSASKVENDKDNFRQNMSTHVNPGSINFAKDSTVEVELAGPENEANKYVYVMVTTANGYPTIVSYEIGEGSTQVDSDDTQTPGTSSGVNLGETGLFDYGLGQLIMLVLVVVLIVSCALIITQKIVDHKKRLY